MSVQELAALAVVAATLGLFVGSALRRRRQLPWQRAGHCGCVSPTSQTPGAHPPQVIRIQGRKGEVPQVILTSSQPKLARSRTVD